MIARHRHEIVGEIVTGETGASVNEHDRLASSPDEAVLQLHSVSGIDETSLAGVCAKVVEAETQPVKSIAKNDTTRNALAMVSLLLSGRTSSTSSPAQDTLVSIGENPT